MIDAMPISIDGEILASLRTDIDTMIGRTLKTMAMTKNGEATVTCKIKITLNEEVIPVQDGVRNAVRPTFEHDVQSVVQTKDKTSGTMSGDYELVYDAENDQWVVKSTRQQMSMFDTDDRVDVTEQAEADDTVNLESVRCLPAGEDDADYPEDDVPDNDVGETDDGDDFQPDDEPDYEPDYGPEE